ncbi:MAG: hypothetical protein Q7R53_01895 [bacterium]|nr:hypothetical protein [bacterium]
MSFRQHYEYTSLLKDVKTNPLIANFFLYPWANFDGIHYLLIAGEGYTNNFGFLPLFPILIKTLALLIGGGSTFGPSYFFSGLTISNLAFLASLFVFYKLLLFDYKRNTATTSIIFLLLFPTSFYFGAVYSESLFFLLTLLTFYFARKKKWLAAGITGMFLSITRIVGIFILPALIYEFIKQEKIDIRKIKNIFKLPLRLWPLFFIPLGIFGYVIYNFVNKGEFFYFISAHGNLGNERTVNSIILFPQTIFRYIKILFSIPYSQFEWWIALLEIVTFFTVSFLLYLSWRKKIRFSYLIFSIPCFLLPVFSGTFTGLPRYSLVLFPIFISLALINPKLVKIFYVIIAPILLFLLLMFFSKGYFIS